ncbi:MAG: protease modulator HflC [Alphaproteobacteria bacterium]|nr:protease modulator HflC [Alphaproteobacteria bacterium]
MTRNIRSFGPIIVALACLFLFNASVFTVDQTKQALVLQFGEAKIVHTTPGLKFKIPFIQDVTYYDKRVLDYDLPPILVTTVDQKRLIVDTYTRYRINDTLLFFQSVAPATEVGAKMRLEAVISSAVRNVLGKAELRTTLSAERSTIMRSIEEEVRAMAKPLGLDIIDVRIIRTELPPENRDAVFARMNSELDRFAKENRAKGAEIAQGVRSRADKDRTVLLAEAYKKSQTIRGEGDAASIKIATESFGKDLDFYNFYRTMETYRESLGSDTSLILSTDSQLFSFFSDPLKFRIKQ